MSDDESLPVFTDSLRSFPHHELASKVPLLRKSKNNDDYDDDIVDMVRKRPELPSYIKAEQYRLSQLNVMESNAGMPPQYYPLTSTTMTLGRITTDIAIYFEMLFIGSFTYLILGVLSIPLMIEYYRNTPHDYGIIYHFGISDEYTQTTDTASITNILLIIIMTVILLFTRFRWFRVRNQLETLHTGIHHYSVILYNISASLRDTETVAQYFRNLQDDVLSVVLIPRKLNHLVRLYSQHEKLENEIERLKLGGTTSNSEIDAILNTLHKVETNINLNEFSPKMCGVAIVTFKHEASTTKALKTLNASFCCRYCVCACCNKKRFYGRSLYAIRAAPPSDIIYENLKYGIWSHIWRGALLGLCCILSVILLISMAVGITQATPNESVTQYIEHIPYHVLFSVSVLSIKKLIAFVLKGAVKAQKLHLRSQQQSALFRFTFITEYLFLTGAVIATSRHALFTADWAIAVQDKLFSIHIGLLFASILSPISPFYRTRKFIKSKLAVTQKDLHEAVSPPEFNAGSNGGELLALQVMTVTFSQIYPLGYFFSAACLQARYWCYKYECLRINQKAVSYASFMTNTTSTQAAVLVLAVCSALQVNSNYQSLWSVITVICSVIAYGLLAYDTFGCLFFVPATNYTQGRPLTQQPDIQPYELPRQKGAQASESNDNTSVTV